MIKPKVGEDTSDKLVDKGTLQKTYDYLKTSDPTSYYYNKLKDSNNPFLNDKMWAEATRRGESDILATILENRMQYEAGKEYTGGDQESAGTNSIQQLDKEGIDAFSRWQSYQDLADYDSYMLALEIPMLDNNEKKDRIAENGYNFGQYTDREWALEILNSQFQKIDAQIIESNKNVGTFFNSIGVAIAAAPTKVLGGVSRFLQDIYNTGEGLLNVLFNWSQDDPEQRFLWAFSNDEGQFLNELANELTYCTYDIERRLTGFIDANLAYEQGYVAGTNIGRGVGYTSIGQMYRGVMDSIGYMIPSMLTNILIPGSGTAVFYTGMAAGEIKDQVETAALNGISYKDLNSGEIIANASLKAAAQAAIEIALDKLLGLTQIDRLRGVKGKVVSKIPDVTAKGWKAAEQVLARMGKEALQEGLEEVLQDMSDGLIDMCFGNFNPQNEIYQRGLEKYNISDLTNSFIAGALTSIIIGSVANLKYIPQSQRGVGINEAGEAYTFGFFQTLNYAEALRTINEWNNILNDESTTLEDKMSTVIKMNSALNMLGSLFSGMGIENSTKANELLNRFADKQARESVLKTKDSKTSAYWSIANTTKAFEKFMSNNKTLAEAYIPKSLGDKIKETFSKLASKKNLPTNTEVESITTTDMKTGDEKIEMSNEALETLKKVANNVGAKVIIGTNNAIITRDGDIAIVSQKIIDTINAKDAHAEIVRGLAYDKAISAISDNLLDGQKQFILDTYVKVTGDNTATLEIAIDTLLFDKSFYTELLLLSGERNAKASIDLLVKINEIVKKELSKLDSKVDSQAAKVLLQKIVNNMRSGFTMYATKYADVNIDEISDEVLPKDLKDTIRNHQNVVFTRSVLRAIAKAKSKVQYNNKELMYLDKMIDAFAQYLTPEIVAQLKRDIRGSNETAKLQALGIIQYCSKLDNSYGSNKVIILPSVNNGNQVKAEQYTKELCDLFGGVSLDQIANGDYDVNKLSDTVVSFVSQTNKDGLQMYSLETKQDRLEVAKALLFELSKSMFTINANFNLCQVISRNEFLKTEYLNDAKLLNDIKDGKVKTIKDIVKVKNIDKNLLAISIVLSNTRNSSYTDGNDYISISRFAKSAGASIMHELTHVSQYLIMASNPNSVITTGGSAALFKGLQKDVEQDLEKYILDNFPILYNLLKKTNNKNTYQDVIYYLLEGELEANVSISGLLPATGFTLKNNYTVLASPNNKKTWSLKVGSVEQKIFEIAKEQVSEKADIKTEPEQMDDLQYGILDKTLNKSRPTNDAYITVQNTYEVEPNEALKYVMKVTGKNVEGNDFSELIKAAEGITLDKNLSKDSIKLFKAGLDYAKRLQQYYQDMANWLEKVKAARAKKENKKHTSKDIPMTKLELIRDKSLSSYIKENKGKLLSDKFGVPDIYYRGAENLKDLELGARGDGIRFFSTKPFVSSIYAQGPKAELVGYLVNVEPKDILKIPVKGGNWSTIEYKGKKYSTDDLLKKLIAENTNKKAILFENILESPSENYNIPGNSLVVIDNSILKRITIEEKNFIQEWNKIADKVLDEYEDDAESEFNKFVKKYKEQQSHVSEDREILHRSSKDTIYNFNKELGKTRQIPQKRALQSNLKYFIPKEKGLTLQMHPGVADFIEATTADENKLSNNIRNLIHQGKLDKSYLKDLVAFGKANEYELQMIAKYIFRNELVTKMSRKEFNALLKNIEDISIAAYLLSNAEGNLEEEYSIEEMLALKNELSKEHSAEELSKASYQSITTLVKDENGKLKPIEVILDPTQLVLPFLRYYDGTLNGILTINKIAKKLAVMQSTDIVTSRINDIGEISNWNWASLMNRAESIYDEELDDTLNELTDEDKRTAIKQYLQDNLIAKLGNKTYTAAQQVKIAAELQQRLDYIDTLEGEKLNKIYLGTIQQETSGQKSGKQAIEGIDTVDIKEQLSKRPTSEKSSTDRIRILANNIATKIGKSKVAYNNLPDKLKPLFVTGKYNKYQYVGAHALKDMSKEDKEALVPVLQEAYSKLKERADIKRAQARAKEKEAERLTKLTEKMSTKETSTRTTFREKIEIIHKTKIVNQTFVVESPMELTYNTDPAIPASGNLVEELLNTTWDKYKVSEVQGVESNENTFVANYNKFLKDNAVNILSADVNTIAEVCKWFLNTRLSMNATDEDVDQFNVIKQFILETVNTMSKGDGLYSALDQDLKNKIDKWVQRNASASGRSNAIHGAILKAGDPLATLRSEEMNIDGVVIPDELKDKVYDAINSMDITKINEATREAQAYASKNKTSKKSFLHKIQTIRQLDMLSGPLTWLRNKVSNLVLKRLNKVASAIGNRVFKGKTSTTIKQIKLANSASTEAKNYIQKNFVDTGYFDKLVTSLSKYNPSSVRQKNGVKTKEEIMASLVIKTLYNEYYNEHNFDSKFMNKAFQWIMARMSDDAYVREAAIRYFGRIITEKGYDLSQDGITDEIMNDFSNALGLAMSDYMHSDNFFNVLERAIAEKSEAGWFVYKTILPFASASWNWFKAMTKLTPFGLAKSIVDMHYLEKRVAKQQALWMAGKTQINPELTEYMIRRDIGTGVIGTIGFGVGILLAALGFIRLDDDDYGNPKLRIGNLTIDISSIFGASSILAGGALITGIRDEHSFNAALNRMLDVTLDNFPIMDILQLDMYSNGAWDVMQSTAESLATSYIPNLISYFAGATYTGKLKKDTFWKRAIAKIPFLGNFLDKQVNPYTGDTGSYIDAINRIVPYFSYEAASLNESKTNELGLNKSQLRGNYTINDKNFSVSGNDLQKLNENYGKWNAADLTKFYSNKLRVRVKVGSGYQTLSYNQMTDVQRKSAVQNIMSNNANLAKIYAWTSQGNKYYASEDTYNKLRNKGITKNVYVGTKGFVEK